MVVENDGTVAFNVAKWGLVKEIQTKLNRGVISDEFK